MTDRESERLSDEYLKSWLDHMDSHFVNIGNKAAVERVYSLVQELIDRRAADANSDDWLNGWKARQAEIEAQHAIAKRTRANIWTDPQPSPAFQVGDEGLTRGGERYRVKRIVKSRGDLIVDIGGTYFAYPLAGQLVSPDVHERDLLPPTNRPQRGEPAPHFPIDTVGFTDKTGQTPAPLLRPWHPGDPDRRAAERRDGEAGSIRDRDRFDDRAATEASEIRRFGKPNRRLRQRVMRQATERRVGPHRLRLDEPPKMIWDIRSTKDRRASPPPKRIERAKPEDNRRQRVTLESRFIQRWCEIGSEGYYRPGSDTRKAERRKG